VTPTSQIVGSQAVLNVLMGERYKTITNETAGVLKGAYGATPAPVKQGAAGARARRRRGAHHLPPGGRPEPGDGSADRRNSKASPASAS
jgi:hypothetical protein